jgi:hypothetical protein
MKEEQFYGESSPFDWNDEYAFCSSDAASSGADEKIEKPAEHLDLNNSNSRLDKFLFYYSSKL